MQSTLMNLKVLLPFRIFAEETDVFRIIAETREGSFGLLPHRLDCVAALTPGILIYEKKPGGEVYVAVDEGVLVKIGLDVLVSVHNAIGGTDLDQLRDHREHGLCGHPLRTLPVLGNESPLGLQYVLARGATMRRVGGGSLRERRRLPGSDEQPDSRQRAE